MSNPPTTSEKFAIGAFPWIMSILGTVVLILFFSIQTNIKDIMKEVKGIREGQIRLEDNVNQHDKDIQELKAVINRKFK